MKEYQYTQMLAIEGNTPQDTATKFNQAMIDLRANHPRFERVSETLFFIYYEEYSKEPETKADEYEINGCAHRCVECAQFCPHTTVKGKIDKRAKIGKCAASGQPTFKDSAACDAFYYALEKEVADAEEQQSNY